MPDRQGGSISIPHQELLEGFLRLSVCIYFLAAAAAAAAAAHWPLLSCFAAHGKTRQQAAHTSSNSNSRLLQLLQWVATRDFSKRRFLDFYLIGCSITCCCLAALQQQQLQQWQRLSLLLLLLHLMRRLGEQLLLVVTDDSSRMHLFAYALGCTYYVATPLAFLLAVRRCIPVSLPLRGASLGIWIAGNWVQVSVHRSALLFLSRFIYIYIYMSPEAVTFKTFYCFPFLASWCFINSFRLAS